MDQSLSQLHQALKMNFFSKYNLQILVVLAVAVIFVFGPKGFAEKKQVASVESVFVDKTVLSNTDAVAVGENMPIFELKNGENSSLGAGEYLPSKIFTEIQNNPRLETEVPNVLVADLMTSEKYFEKNINKRWPIASLTKLMTGYIAFEKLNMADTVILKKEDIDINESEIFSEGDSYSVKDLVRVMLISSRNTAANALANYFGRSAFLELMNSNAKEWGMSDTNFEDPSGLSVANQSTAMDLLKLSQVITKDYPDIWKITENTKVSIKELTTKRILTSNSTNQFTERSDFFGGKTGYIPASDGNLLSVFLYQKRTIVIITLGSQDRFGDTEKIFNWFINGFRTSN